MTGEAIWDWVLGWLIRGAGLFWLLGSFMLFRQIRTEMALDRITSEIARVARDAEASAPAGVYGDLDAPPERREMTSEEKAADAWIDRDDAARRGWIAGQAVVLAVTAMTMIVLHPLASGFAALLVMGQGIYFIWRETIARRAPNAEAAVHARPSASTVNASWVSLAIACLVWTAAFRGVLR